MKFSTLSTLYGPTIYASPSPPFQILNHPLQSILCEENLLWMTKIPLGKVAKESLIFVTMVTSGQGKYKTFQFIEIVGKAVDLTYTIKPCNFT